MAVKDKAIPDKLTRDSKCIAVITSMVKIAVGFGENHGKGIATCLTEHGWSAPAPVTITGGSWGLQASAAAIHVGRDAGTDTDIKMRAEGLTYSRVRRLFAGVDRAALLSLRTKKKRACSTGRSCHLPGWMQKR